MKLALLKYLACPQCRSELSLISASSLEVQLLENELEIIQETEREAKDYTTEIMDGVLMCTSCSERYPIVNFIPRLYRQAPGDFNLTSADPQITPHKDERHVQQSFSREWDELNYEDGLIWLWNRDSRITTFCEEVRITS